MLFEYFKESECNSPPYKHGDKFIDVKTKEIITF